MASPTHKHVTDSEEMEGLGALLATGPRRHGLVFLRGELGAGKTTFVRGYLRACGVTGAVKSPTYTLIEPYELGDLEVFHMDFYRLTDVGELELIGIRDYLGAGLLFVEWPERAGQMLPAPDLTICIATLDSGRRLSWQAHSEFGEMMSLSLSKV